MPWCSTFTRWGYEVRLSGANPEAARYAGIPVRRRIIAVMLLSGALAGIAGMLEVAGTVHRLQGGISNNFGYVGIMVAILARGSCLGVIAAAALMAVILNAGIVLQTKGITTNTVLALTGLILLLHRDRRRARPLSARRIARRSRPEERIAMDILAGILSVAVLAGGVLALGALGEVLCERVGVVNLGVEGLMAMGAVVAIIVVMTVPNVYLALRRRLPPDLLLAPSSPWRPSSSGRTRFSAGWR